MKVETVKVVREDSEDGYEIINKSDFDPDKHEIYDGPEAVEAPDTGAPSGEQSEVDNTGGSDVLCLEEAVMHCMEPGNEDCLTNTGKPNLDKLKELTGETVTAAQRDEVFKAAQE